MDIVNRIHKILVDAGIVVPVQYGWYDEDIRDTHITYFTILEVPEETSDDEIELLSYHIQVDIWSLEDDIRLKRKVRKALTDNDFIFIENRDEYEKDTKIYHKAMRFKVLVDYEEEEKWQEG